MNAGALPAESAVAVLPEIQASAGDDPRVGSEKIALQVKPSQPAGAYQARAEAIFQCLAMQLLVEKTPLEQ